MAEETEGQEIGAEAQGAVVDPVAVALALGGASREEADAFLKKLSAFLDNQSALIAAQKHHVGEQSKYLHEQFQELGLNIWQQRMGVLLRIATGFVGLAVAAGLALMIWDAVHANGLVIQSFSVPPDLASRGLTGQVVASQMQDKLTAMQNVTGSSRPPQSYANNWGDDIKVEIPETGVSIGEAYRFLKEWLGHETHVTGEVYRTATGIAVTARTGADVGGTYLGTESDLDALVQKAAEHVYGSTQPYRYGFYLENHYPVGVRPVAEERAIYTKSLSDPDPLEQAWAWIGLNNIDATAEGNMRAAVIDLHKAIAVDPDIPSDYINLGDREYYLGHSEASLAAYRTLDRLLNRSTPLNIDAQYVNPYRMFGHLNIAMLLGDYTSAISPGQSGAGLNNSLALAGPEDFRRRLLLSFARQHDGNSALAFWRSLPPTSRAINAIRAIIRLQMDAALENWPAIVASEPSVDTFREDNPGRDINAYIGEGVRPFLALAKAKLGDIAGAEAVIAAIPSDCYDCIRMRGDIAAVEGNWGRADYWFARAVHDGPSLPFAESDWGQMLLQKGDPDAAIAKFTIANQKGPHFADPLEMWGEALLKKNRSDLALAKFAEAGKYAPNWGRLHLKWGEALDYAGHKDEAQKQFALSNGLNLSSADRAELTREKGRG